MNAIQRLSIDLDADLVREVVVLFLEDTRVRIDELRKLSAAQERTQLFAAAHKIKGSCGSLGANALMTECERLENLTRSGTREQIEECIQRVAQLFEVIVPTLRAYLSDRSA
jgi:HPt (histidine-containing phosphotransfer) domain-containing protein